MMASMVPPMVPAMMPGHAVGRGRRRGGVTAIASGVLNLLPPLGALKTSIDPLRLVVDRVLGATHRLACIALGKCADRHRDSQ